MRATIVHSGASRTVRNSRHALARWLLGTCALATGLASITATNAVGQVTSHEAKDLGLEVAWQAQMQLPRSGRGVVSSQLWVDSKIQKQYAVVELADRTIRVSADHLDRKGNPIGLEEAKKQAQEQATRLMFGKSDGFQVVEVSVPQIRLVVVSSDGVIQNFDAETGDLKWSTACGRVGAPAHPAAVSPAGVTLVHGGEIFLIDWETGRQLMRRKLRSGSSNAVAVCNDLAIVSDFRGRVEAYGLGRDITEWSYVMHGRAVGHPVTMADQSFAAIATTDGHAYVFAAGNKPTLWIRYDTEPSISGSLSAGNGAFYVASTIGVLGKISPETRLGTIKWEFRAGKSVSKPALVENDQVYLATEAGDLFAIDDADGTKRWSLPLSRISTPIAVADNKVFCTTSSNQIVAIDNETGKVNGQTGVIELAEPVLNSITDRIYLVTQLGKIQCLRPIDGVLPNLVTPLAPTDASPEKTDSPTAPTAPTEDSPFDAFGGETGAGEDPFGGSDPFGGGDPFGGAAGDEIGDPS